MHQLPDDFEFLLLSSCYLEMVCFGVGVTRLDFSRPQNAPGIPPYKVSFCVEGVLRYKINNLWGVREFANSYTSAPLLDLLLRDVASVECLEGSTLQVLFSTGDTLVIEGSEGADYESYSIYMDSGEVVVV